MDLDNPQSEYSSKDDNEKLEPGELFEETWFFGNLLWRKSRMLRSLSDPCPCSNYNHHYEETYESIDKLSDEINRTTLIESPSAASSFRGKRSNRKKTSLSSSSSSSKRSLIRTPSLPTRLETEEFEDEEEIEFSMGKLIRQASMKNYSDTLPPRTQSTKGSTLTSSCSISRYGSRTNTEVESIKVEEIRHQRRMNQPEIQRSLIDLESQESRGFKDLGFHFYKKQHLPEACSAPPAPKWGGKRSTEDMKAQIKFWARAVASNVRQEC